MIHMIEDGFCKVLLELENAIYRIYWEIANSVKFWCLHPHTGGPTLAIASYLALDHT